MILCFNFEILIILSEVNFIGFYRKTRNETRNGRDKTRIGLM